MENQKDIDRLLETLRWMQNRTMMFMFFIELQLFLILIAVLKL